MWSFILHDAISKNDKLKLTLLYFRPNQASQMAQDGGDFDVFAFITYPGASGIAMGGQACPGAPGGDKISFNRGYGPNDCDTYDPPEWIPCTVSNRIVLTAEVFNTYDMWLTYISAKRDD